MKIDPLLQTRKVLVACGTGGVGKTTVSAALGIRAAELGKKVVVITIDPAKRLGTALGQSSLGDAPIDLTPELEKSLGRSISGKYFAILPQNQATFEGFVRTIAPSDSVVNSILENPIFQMIAQEFSGASEYMALQKLDALVKDPRFDLVLLDTPPSQNTVHFLNAPLLISQFFDEPLVKWLIVPSNRLLAFGLEKVLGVLEKLTGKGFIHSLMQFFSDVLQIREGFTALIHRVTELFRSDRIGFLMVAGPSGQVSEELKHLLNALEEKEFQFDGFILNRSLGFLDTSEGAGELTEGVEIIKGIQSNEQKLFQDIGKMLSSSRWGEKAFLIRLPELSRDIHGISDLYSIAQSIPSD